MCWFCGGLKPEQVLAATPEPECPEPTFSATPECPATTSVIRLGNLLHVPTPKGSWLCPPCLQRNGNHCNSCYYCGHPRISQNNLPGSTPKDRWKCLECAQLNYFTESLYFTITESLAGFVTVLDQHKTNFESPINFF